MLASHAAVVASAMSTATAAIVASRRGQRRGASATARGRTGVWGGRVRVFTACTLSTGVRARYPLAGLPPRGRDRPSTSLGRRQGWTAASALLRGHFLLGAGRSPRPD